jgi:hypothetical protein
MVDPFYWYEVELDRDYLEQFGSEEKEKGGSDNGKGN